MRMTALILVIALAPGTAVAQVATAQEKVQRSTEATTERHEDALSEDASERLQGAQGLRRTIELLRQPGFHPELMELLGLDSEVDADRESLLASTTTGPPALSTGNKIAIAVGVAVVALVIWAVACYASGQSGSCGE